MTHQVSATYCPDGRKYEWRTDARGAELLARVLQKLEKKQGGEWVDVRVGVVVPGVEFA